MSLVRIAAACSVIASQLAIADTTRPTFEGITDAYVRRHGKEWTTKDTIARRPKNVTYHGISAAIDRATRLLNGVQELSERSLCEATRASKLKEILNGYLTTGKSFKLTPAQLNYRMLVARLCTEISYGCGVIWKTSRDNIVKEFCEEDGEAVDKWWKKLHIDGNTAVQAKRIYSPVSDSDLYWRDMAVATYITDRMEVIRKLCGWKKMPVPCQCDYICDKCKGKVIVDSCRLFAMNHDMEVTSPYEEDDHSLQWKALRNITVVLQNTESEVGDANLDTEFKILEDHFNEVVEQQGTPGCIKDAPNGRYEYLRRVVLGAHDDAKSLELEKETGATVDDAVTEITGDRVTSTASKFIRLEGVYNGAFSYGYNALQHLVRDKIWQVVDADGKVAAVAVYRQDINVKDNDSSVARVEKAGVALRNTIGRGLRTRTFYPNLGVRPTFVIKKLNTKDGRAIFVKLEDEIVVYADGSAKWVDCPFARVERDEIWSGSRKGRILQLYGIHITEFDRVGTHFSCTFQRSGNQYVYFGVNGAMEYTLDGIHDVIARYTDDSILTLVYKEIKRVPAIAEEQTGG